MKSDAMNKFLASLTQTGMGPNDAVKAAKCALCGKDAKEFKDALSKKEFTISGMCQACQDGFFG